MRRKGDVSEIIMVVFALVVGMLIIYLLVPKIAIPSMDSYGDKQAYITAKILASSINSLSSMEEGHSVRNFELDWDISIECKRKGFCYLEVGHKDFLSTDIDAVALMGDAEEAEIYAMNKVKITKETGKPVRIEGVWE